MAASNILNIPFRRTLPIDLSSAIKSYISSNYDPHPDQFTSDLEEISRLRVEAVSVLEPHSGGIRRIQCYAAQLVWLTGKFPIDMGCDFTWYPALGYNIETPIVQNNIRFELANVLFNLCVLYCQIAYNANRSTSDGLKSASNFFCLSAGVIRHLKEDIIPEMRSTPPEDMDPMTLECLQSLLLAQAQECFWEKARKDGLKDALVAKLAARVSDLYGDASDWAIKSETISSEWIHHMTAKNHHFAAAAQYRAARDCLEKRKYGEEVARLQHALQCANEGMQESRYVNKIVIEDLTGLRNKVRDELNRAEKDNDSIYYSPVPPRSEMKALDRVSMVEAKITPSLKDPVSCMGDQAELGKPLFTKLVPYSVHVAASIYASRRDQIIKNITDELEALNQKINDMLQSLNLPGALQAVEKPLGLPSSLTSHAEEIRQQNGPERLRRTFHDVDKIRSSDKKTYQEGIQSLQTEANEDDAARKKYGTDRWMRPGSTEAGARLHAQIGEIEQYFKTAQSSDDVVWAKYREHTDIIDVLNSNDRRLEEYVPSSRRVTLTPAVEREVSRLRDVLNSVNRLQSRRKRKIETLRMKAEADNVYSELLKEASKLERANPMAKVEAVQFEDFFDRRLERYVVDQAVPKEEEREQSQALNQLTEANNAFRSARRGDNQGGTREREQALQRLENAYFVYKQIVQDLDVGRKFYNDLAPIVATFRDECRSFGLHRRNEAQQLESDIVNALPMGNLNLQQQQQQQQQQTSPRKWTHNQNHAYKDIPAAGHAASLEEPLAAPQPIKPQHPPAIAQESSPTVGTWNPGMPIAFGPPSTAASQATAGASSNPSNGLGAAQAKNGDRRWDPTQGMKFG